MMMTGLARLGRDAEVRYTPDGKPVASVALAFSYGKRSDNLTQWIDASLWGDRAEKLAQYLTKGKQLSVVLEDPHIQTFQRKDGTTGAKLVARIGSLEFAGSAPTPAAAPAEKPAAPVHPAIEGLDSDIPFSDPYKGRMAYIV